MEISDIVSIIKRYPLAWISGVCSMALGLYLYFTASTLGAYENQLFDLEKEVQTLKSNSKQGMTIEDDSARFAELFSRVEAELMDHTQIAKNNGFFYNFASGHPVDISDVSQQAVIEESANPQKGDIWSRKEYSVIPFHMRVNGLLTDIIDMFYQFDASEKLIKIRNFKISTTSRPEVGYMDLYLEINVLGKPVKEVQQKENGA